jgi:hypothetical protein
MKRLDIRTSLRYAHSPANRQDDGVICTVAFGFTRLDSMNASRRQYQMPYVYTVYIYCTPYVPGHARKSAHIVSCTWVFLRAAISIAVPVHTYICHSCASTPPDRDVSARVTARGTTGEVMCPEAEMIFLSAPFLRSTTALHSSERWSGSTETPYMYNRSPRGASVICDLVVLCEPTRCFDHHCRSLLTR